MEYIKHLSDHIQYSQLNNIREWLFFVLHSLGLMATHIRPKKSLNLIPHMHTPPPPGVMGGSDEVIKLI